MPLEHKSTLTTLEARAIEAALIAARQVLDTVEHASELQQIDEALQILGYLPDAANDPDR